MKREDLRKIGYSENQDYHEGYFHKWSNIERSYSNKLTVHAIIERKDGLIVIIPHTDIKFL